MGRRSFAHDADREAAFLQQSPANSARRYYVDLKK